MIYRPSNPLSVVFFLFSWLADFILSMMDWMITRYHMMLFRYRTSKAKTSVVKSIG